MSIDLSGVMGFGPSDSSWLPNRETTIAICSTLVAAVFAIYMYKTITQRSLHTRTKHVASEVEMLRLCEQIKEEPLLTLDKSIRQQIDGEKLVVSANSFYFKEKSNEKSALVSACRYGKSDVVKYFLNNFSKCVSVDSTANLDLPVGRYHSMREVHRCSALYAACFHGDAETVLHLLKSHADINQPDCLGRTPLQMASLRGHLFLVQELLQHGADPDISDDHGYTPLLSAVSENQVKVVAILMDNNVDLYHMTNNGYTALHIAAENGFRQIIELLLRYGTHTQPSYDHKHKLPSPAVLAASRGHTSTTQLLIESARQSPAQDPDVLLLWGAALLSPQHKYIKSSVKRYWVEALELKEQHSLLGTTLTPLEVYEYRSEMSRIDEVLGYFSSNPPSTSASPTSSTRDISRPLEGHIRPLEGPAHIRPLEGVNLLSSNSTIYLTPDGTTEVFYQSLIVFERCLGYGDPILIKRLIEVAKYMLSKRKFQQANLLLSRSLEMSMDRICRQCDPFTDFCHHSEMEYEIKSMLQTLCELLSEFIANKFPDLSFSLYLNYLTTAFDGYRHQTRYDCYGNPANINEHVIILMLSVLAAWVHYRNTMVPEALHEDISDFSELKEFEECKSLASKLVNDHMYLCTGTSLLHLTLAKLGSRDSLVRNYSFLKDISSFVTALIQWSDHNIVNLADSSGNRPLHVAAQRARTELEATHVIGPLLRHGAHIDACNARGKTAAEIKRHKTLQHNRPKCLSCLCYNKIIEVRIDYDSLPLSRNFTQRDKELLRLHDPEWAQVEYQQLLLESTAI